jgi:hypothetical protein
MQSQSDSITHAVAAAFSVEAASAGWPGAAAAPAAARVQGLLLPSAAGGGGQSCGSGSSGTCTLRCSSATGGWGHGRRESTGLAVGGGCAPG